MKKNKLFNKETCVIFIISLICGVIMRGIAPEFENTVLNITLIGFACIVIILLSINIFKPKLRLDIGVIIFSIVQIIYEFI